MCLRYKIYITVLFIFSVFVFSSSADAATYYVAPNGSDSSSGTQTTPWRTIQKVASTMVAGDTAIIMNGTYTEGSVQFANNGVEGRPITLQAQNKWGAILASTSGCNPAIYIRKNYITVDGLKFSVSPSNVKCVLTGGFIGAGGNSWNSALWCDNGHHCIVRNNYVDISSQRDYGLKSLQDYSIFENNIVGSGVQAFGSYGSIIRNNTLFHADSWNNYMYGKGGVHSLQMYNNIINTESEGAPGIAVGGYSGNSTEAYNTVAYNNVIIMNGGGSRTALGFINATNSAIYNNIVVGGQLFSTGSSGVLFKNNIISCNGGSAVSSGALSLDYNNFYNCTGVPSQAHPITGDPKFVNPASDWHLQTGSPAIDSGTPLTFTGYNGETINISQDRDGVTRSLPWDLGIYNVGASGITPTPVPTPTPSTSSTTYTYTYTRYS